MPAMGSVVLQRAITHPVDARPTRAPAWLSGLLRVPLVGKIAGANALIVLSAWVAAAAMMRNGAANTTLLLVLILALGGSLVVNVLLVVLALRPIGDLQRTAERVWTGDLDARVPHSPLADADIARVGGTLNLLLDGLIADRARMRRLAADVIHAGDRERARIARELHDSTAQSLAAISYHLTALSHENDDVQQVERLAAVKQLTSEVLEEVRMLAHTMHPRVLDDLGLPAALRNLVREAQLRTSAVLEVEVDDAARALPSATASVLYRVAQESVANAIAYAGATAIRVRLSLTDARATLEVHDDGSGFDVDAAASRRPGMGLFSMRERVGLASGRFTIDSSPGRGTLVRADVPLTREGV
jgi:signal transduction histidine kinase